MATTNVSYFKRLVACSYFFIAPGLAYGSLTSRLPAIMENTGADTRQIGLMLFTLGFMSLISLIFSNKLITNLGSHVVLLISTILLLTFTTILSYAPNPIVLILLCAMIGSFIGMIDVAMNTQGILLEKNTSRKSMSKLHAFYSIGAVVAAILASFFAKFNVSVHVNFITVFGIYILWAYFCFKNLYNDKETSNKQHTHDKNILNNKKMPLLVFICGIVSLLVYAIEGSVGEWGSIYLYQEKGSNEATAALVYAFFSICAVLSKLIIDNLRNYISDLWIIITGCIICFISFTFVLLTNNSFICLILYGVMGFAIAPIVPIAFSVAGSQKGITAKDASIAVSRLAYTGLLFFPPILGFVAKIYSLQTALHIVLLQIILVLILAFFFKQKKA